MVMLMGIDMASGTDAHAVVDGALSPLAAEDNMMYLVIRDSTTYTEPVVAFYDGFPHCWAERSCRASKGLQTLLVKLRFFAIRLKGECHGL
jgi:hypothetical protein